MHTHRGSMVEESLRLTGRLLTFGLAAIIAFVLSGVIMKPILPDGLPAAGAERIVVVSAMLVTALMLAHFAVVLIFERTKWDATGFGVDGWRPLALITGLVAGTLGVLIPAGALYFGGAIEFQAADPGPIAPLLLDAFIVLSAPALFEELLVRGYVFGTIAKTWGDIAAVVITSLVFGLMHGMNPGASVWTLLAVTVAGVFLASVRLSTGSLAATWLAHVAINWVQGGLLHAPISGLDFLPSPNYEMVATGPAWLTGGEWGLEAGAATALTLLIVSFLLFRFRPVSQDRLADSW